MSDRREGATPATLQADPLANRLSEVLDRRLDARNSAPIAVAFSGGGDSLALLLLAKIWADLRRRTLVAITVDHRLQPQSAQWALWCRARAERMGVRHQTVEWSGAKPSTGIQGSARIARHGLLADAARAMGAGVILMGHTADDCLEAAVMRRAGSRNSAPREWAPSPVWPRGRGVYILRPLLAARRAELRTALTAAGQTWIEDPANSDPRSARAQARFTLAEGAFAAAGDGPRRPRQANCAALLESVRQGAAGELSIDIEAFTAATPDVRRAFLGAAVVCVSGSAAPPRSEALDRLLGRIGKRAPFTASLCGARIAFDGARLQAMREAGEMRRAGDKTAALQSNRAVVWDGRYEIRARVPNLVVRSMQGSVGKLPRADRAALRNIAPAARPTLFAIDDLAGQITCPILAWDDRVEARPLIMERFAGAAGAVANEAAIWRVAQARANAYMQCAKAR